MVKAPCPSQCGDCCNCCGTLAAKFRGKCIEFVFHELGVEDGDDECACCGEIDEGTFRKGLTVEASTLVTGSGSTCICEVRTFGIGSPTELDLDCTAEPGCADVFYANLHARFCDPAANGFEDYEAFPVRSFLGVTLTGIRTTGTSGLFQAQYGYNLGFGAAEPTATNAEIIDMVEALAAGDTVDLPLITYPGLPDANPNRSLEFPPDCAVDPSSTVSIRLVPDDETCDDYPTNPDPDDEFTCEEFEEDCFTSGDFSDTTLDCMIYGAEDRTEPTVGGGCPGDQFHFTLSELNSEFAADFITAAAFNALTGSICSVVDDGHYHMWGTIGDYDDPGKRIAWIEDSGGTQREMYAVGIMIALDCEVVPEGQDGLVPSRIDIITQTFARGDATPMTDSDSVGTACLNSINIEATPSSTLYTNCLAPWIFAECLILDSEEPCDPNTDAEDRFLLRASLGPVA